jgi:hypothetical protein
MVESFISDRVLTVLAASDRERLESKQRAAAASKPLLDGIFASFGKWGPLGATPDGILPGSTLHDIVPDQHSSDSADSLHLGYTQREALMHHPTRHGRSGRQALPGAPISARILHDEFGTFRLVGMDASGLDIDDDADVLTSADEAEDAFYEGLLMQSHHPSAAALPAPPAAVTSAHITSITAAVAARDAAAAAAAGRSSPPRSMLSSLSSPPRGLSLAPMLSLWQQLSTAVQQRGAPSSSAAAAVTAHTLSPAAPAPPGSSSRLPARYQQHASYQYQLSSSSSSGASSASASNSASSLGSVDPPSTSTSIPSISLSQFQQHRQQEQQQLLQPPGPLSASVAHYLRSRPRLRDMLDASRASAASANDIMSHRSNPRAPAQLG